VSDPPTSSPAPALAPENLARVRVAPGPLVGPVLSRVVAMLATRGDCPLDRMEDALLAVDAIAAYGPAFVDGGRLELTANVYRGRLELAAGPFAAGRGGEVLERMSVPGIGNVLERVADEVRVKRGDGDSEVLIAAFVY
jgi:hypothetical protein